MICKIIKWIKNCWDKIFLITKVSIVRLKVRGAHTQEFIFLPKCLYLIHLQENT